MMENYSSNLEMLVDDRTTQLVEEKKKTDRLLYSLMPALVAAETGKKLEKKLSFFDQFILFVLFNSIFVLVSSPNFFYSNYLVIKNCFHPFLQSFAFCTLLLSTAESFPTLFTPSPPYNSTPLQLHSPETPPPYNSTPLQLHPPTTPPP